MKKYILRFWHLYLISVAAFLLIVAIGDKTVTVFHQQRSVSRSNVIIIDPGHGGEDGGATSCTGILESHINLEITHRLDALCHLLGFETKMVRTEDISVYTEGTTIASKKASDLRNRVQMVNHMPNAILVSIHQNTFIDQRYSGAQVFYAKTEGSRELAQLIQHRMTYIDKTNRRQEKQADHVYLMNHIQKTGVLIECGFISNPSEEQKLRSAEYQKKLCAVIATSLQTYLNA